MKNKALVLAFVVALCFHALALLCFSGSPVLVKQDGVVRVAFGEIKITERVKSGLVAVKQPAEQEILPQAKAGEENYLSKVLAQIEKAKKYPGQARQKGIEGKVEVEFNILTNGQVKDVKLVKSSSKNLLDQAALKTIMRASPFPKTDSAIRVRLPIIYELL